MEASFCSGKQKKWPNFIKWPNAYIHGQRTSKMANISKIDHEMANLVTLS